MDFRFLDNVAGHTKVPAVDRSPSGHDLGFALARDTMGHPLGRDLARDTMGHQILGNSGINRDPIRTLSPTSVHNQLSPIPSPWVIPGLGF